MKLRLQLLVYSVLLTATVMANDPITEAPINFNALVVSTTISPEIIKELKDFENLIPTATLDEIVAKHYLVDGNFRTALKYLRSNEFTQLQRQLLNMPEILNVLDFLHLTTVNATTRHDMAAAATATALERASLDDYTDNGMDDKMTTNAIATNLPKEAPTTKTLTKRPQPHMKLNDDNDIDVNGDDARTFIEQPPQLRFVLLDDTKVKTKAYDVVPVAGHNDKHITPSSSSFVHSSLGSFTSFVDEILQHLPNAAYQNMIKDKCQKNAKFAEFYKALRSPFLKTIVDEAMKTPNILKVINQLNSQDIDVKSLEPIAFQVISWGPKI